MAKSTQQVEGRDTTDGQDVGYFQKSSLQTILAERNRGVTRAVGDGDGGRTTFVSKRQATALPSRPRLSH